MKTVFNSAPTLADVPQGHTGRVIDVDEREPIGRRLLALGLLPGTEVRVLRSAPLGDPVVYELRGYRLCLRRSEASRVQVEPLESTEAVLPNHAGIAAAPS